MSYIKHVRCYGLIAFIMVMLSACSTQPNTDKRMANITATPAIMPQSPEQGLSTDILYKLLVAEIAGQRDQVEISTKNYLDVAHATHDLDIIKRATQVALYAEDENKAEELARLWIAVDYGDMDAHKILAKIAYKAGDATTALEHLDIVFTSDALSLGLEQKLWVVVDIFNLKDSSEQTKIILEELMAEHQNSADALFAYAKVLIYLKAFHEALTTLEKAMPLQPENENIGTTYVAVLNQMGRIDEGLAWLEATLQKNEDAFYLRIFHARLLFDLNLFDDAKHQFEILLQQKPNDPNVLFSLGLLYMHLGDVEAAEQSFLQLAEIPNYVADAKYHLGRVAETKKDFLAALELYQTVTGGNNYFNAQTRIGILLGKQNKLKEAQAYLRRIPVQNEQQRYFLIQTEAEILANAKQYQVAMDIYDEAVQEQYNTELLYARAMLAEKMGRLDILEQDLRTILAQEPNNAQVLNALGYTLADKTSRYDEAYEFIEQAIAINPHDYHILDSMGWILYQQGELEQAIIYLNKALQKKPDDPEISAHLGEVLWMKGEKKAARATWDAAIKKTPDDEKLRQVIEQFD